MASNNKRRESTRRQLEQRLQERQRREAARKRAVLIGSVTGTVAVIAVVLILVFVFTGGSDHKTVAGSKSGCTVAHPKGSVVFAGVTVKNPTDLTKNPDTTSCSSTTPKTLEYKDLVVGKGATATPTSTVKVQYAGVLYKNGKAFDSSWARGGTPVSFPLTGVVKGFTYGIGGSGTTIPPMRVGGRRIIIVPSTLGYGSQASGSIPANSSLVFVVDLTSITAPTTSSSTPASTTPSTTSPSRTTSTASSSS